jgi:signal transduction histidine kinase/GAF domain-containing protein
MSDLPTLQAALEWITQIGARINHLNAADAGAVQVVLDEVCEAASALLQGTSARVLVLDSRLGGPAGMENAGADDGDDRLVHSDTRILADLAASRKARVLSQDADVPPHPSETGIARACFPLLVGEDVLGTLYAARAGAPYQAAEVLLLEHLADLAAAALGLARQVSQGAQEQTRRERELRRLRRAGMLISSRSNLKGTLDAILQVALEITDAVYGVFRLVDRGGKNLVCMAISGAGLEQPAVEPLPIDGHSVMGTVAARREPIIVSDLRQDPWKGIYYPLDHQLEMRSEVAVPLIGASGRLEGVLNLESPQVDAFDRQHRYILQILATQAVVAIQEARLLDALQEISALLPQLSREAIHQTLVDRTCDLLNVPGGAIWLLEKDHLVCHAASHPQMVGTRLPVDSGLPGQAVREARPVSALLESGSLPQAGEDFLPPGLGSRSTALIAPLSAHPNDLPSGAIGVFSGADDLRNFEQSDWDTKVLDILGHYAALAEQLAAQQEALRVAQDQRALTEAFAAVGDIAANLMHRLNNKVGTIPVRVEGIQDKCAAALREDTYLAMNLQAIQNSAVEAMEVVHESLFHLHPIQLAPVSVAEAVREALASTPLPERVTVRVEGLEALPPVQAGAARLALVFGNLLENAVDAMPGAGDIVIRGVERPGWVDIQVSDDGPGIPPELHERIFEFRYSARTGAHPGKLGFGLWWVKSLAARFGGSVTVESDGSSGSTFTISLPIAAQDANGDDHER